MEQNAEKKETSPEPGHEWEEKPRNPSRNQDMIMEHDTKNIRRQAPETQPQAVHNNGTGWQKIKNESQNPNRNQDIIIEQDTKKKRKQVQNPSRKQNKIME